MSYKHKYGKYKKLYLELKEMVGGAKLMKVYRFHYNAVDKIYGYTVPTIDLDSPPKPYRYTNINGDEKIYYGEQLIYSKSKESEHGTYFLSIEDQHMMIDPNRNKITIKYQVSNTPEMWINFSGNYMDLNLDHLSCRWQLNEIYTTDRNDVPEKKIEIITEFYNFAGYTKWYLLLYTRPKYKPGVSYDGLIKPFLRERHANYERFKNLVGLSCRTDRYFSEYIVDLIVNKLLYQFPDMFVELSRHSEVMSFLVDLEMVANYPPKFSIVCKNRPLIYPYVDKKLVVEPDITEFEFISGDNKNVRLDPTRFNVIFDTGNSSYTLIGSNIVDELGLQIHKSNLPVSGIGGRQIYNHYVILYFSIPYFGDRLYGGREREEDEETRRRFYKVRAYVDVKSRNLLLFGWMSGLDILFENGYYFQKHKNVDLISEVQESARNITSKYNNIIETYKLTPKSGLIIKERIELGLQDLYNTIEGSTLDGGIKENLKVQIRSDFDNYTTLNNRMNRNKLNQTMDLYN